MNRALLVFLLSTITIAGCTEPASHLGSDAAVDAPGRCDPHAGVCRATLRCELYDCESLRLSDGEVRPLEPTWDDDVSTANGRYMVLHGRTGLCRFGGLARTTERFTSLEDVPADACSWDDDANVLCGPGYDCTGAGVLVRDATGQLHRLRIVEHRAEDDTDMFDLEWSAI